MLHCELAQTVIEYVETLMFCPDLTRGNDSFSAGSYGFGVALVWIRTLTLKDVAQFARIFEAIGKSI